MASPHTVFLPQLPDVCSLLSGEAQVQGRRVLDICSALHRRARAEGKLLPAPEDLALRKELGRLIELLARRTSTAIPLATAARVALADLSGDIRFAEQTATECSHAIAMLL